MEGMMLSISTITRPHRSMAGGPLDHALKAAVVGSCPQCWRGTSPMFIAFAFLGTGKTSDKFWLGKRLGGQIAGHRSGRAGNAFPASPLAASLGKSWSCRILTELLQEERPASR